MVVAAVVAAVDVAVAEEGQKGGGVACQRQMGRGMTIDLPSTYTYSCECECDAGVVRVCCGRDMSLIRRNAIRVRVFLHSPIAT